MVTPAGGKEPPAPIIASKNGPDVGDAEAVKPLGEVSPRNAGWGAIRGAKTIYGVCPSDGRLAAD